jgi:hypothetical protein
MTASIGGGSYGKGSDYSHNRNIPQFGIHGNSSSNSDIHMIEGGGLVSFSKPLSTGGGQQLSGGNVES